MSSAHVELNSGGVTAPAGNHGHQHDFAKRGVGQRLHGFIRRLRCFARRVAGRPRRVVPRVFVEFAAAAAPSPPPLAVAPLAAPVFQRLTLVPWMA